MKARRLLVATFGMCVSMAAAIPAQAQAKYPAQTIKLIVPFAAGGGVDAYARILAQQIKEKRKIDMIVENRPGANGTVGGISVARAEPNGYNLLFSASTHVMARQVMLNAPYDPVNDFTAIARVGEAPMLVVMNPRRPQKNIAEVVADMKANPEKWEFGVAALGAMGHLATIGFGHLGNVKLTIVPYRGTAPALNDVAGGHAQLLIDPIIALLPMAQSGDVKALAITTAKRSKLAPQIPTAAEAGMPGLEFASWYGVWGAKSLPKDIVIAVNAMFNEAVEGVAASGRLDTLGIEPVTETPEEFAAYIERDVKRNSELLKAADFQPMQ
jgi:tripartite-type tricarboxylate transporter receptor subunit TctC